MWGEAEHRGTLWGSAGPGGAAPESRRSPMGGVELNEGQWCVMAAGKAKGTPGCVGTAEAVGWGGDWPPLLS